MTDVLTPQETRIALLLVRGKRLAQIAADLSVSQDTVKMHVSHMKASVGAKTTAQMVFLWLYQTGQLRTGAKQ